MSGGIELANNIPPSIKQSQSSFLLAGRMPVASKSSSTASCASPVFFLCKPENNSLDLVKREPQETLPRFRGPNKFARHVFTPTEETPVLKSSFGRPAEKVVKSNQNEAKSKSIRSSSASRIRGRRPRRARSITRRRLLRQLLILHTLLRVIYIKKQLREIERKRRYDYYHNLRRDRRRLFYQLARMRVAEKEAQIVSEIKPASSRTVRRTEPVNSSSSRTDRLLRVFSALEERESTKTEREKVFLLRPKEEPRQDFHRRAA